MTKLTISFNPVRGIMIDIKKIRTLQSTKQRRNSGQQKSSTLRPQTLTKRGRKNSGQNQSRSSLSKL